MPDQPPKPAPKPAPDPGWPLNALKPFGVAPGFVVHGRLDPNEETRQNMDRINSQYETDTTRETEAAKALMAGGDAFHNFVNDLMEHVRISKDRFKAYHEDAGTRLRSTYNIVQDLMEKANIPSTHGDIPLSELITQMKDQPQIASDLTDLSEAAEALQNEYVRYATGPGATESERALIGQIGGTLSLNSLRSFMTAADSQLP